ncbi:uncharacterized protein LOC127084427 isoform X2 [Lathyrus oleraceus]|uniref:uncharacterized protein LOC127084427 isoform X2 n=1 Tax=Pisum sativum TaxID=3888 RepID=UPI0021CF4EE6|nr:uncharacterized protein LOC127084427 isoform X2 [Pisum sativum]
MEEFLNQKRLCTSRSSYVFHHQSSLLRSRIHNNVAFCSRASRSSTTSSYSNHNVQNEETRLHLNDSRLKILNNTRFDLLVHARKQGKTELKSRNSPNLKLRLQTGRKRMNEPM